MWSSSSCSYLTSSMLFVGGNCGYLHQPNWIDPCSGSHSAGPPHLPKIATALGRRSSPKFASGWRVSHARCVSGIRTHRSPPAAPWFAYRWVSFSPKNTSDNITSSLMERSWDLNAPIRIVKPSISVYGFASSITPTRDNLTKFFSIQAESLLPKRLELKALSSISTTNFS